MYIRASLPCKKHSRVFGIVDKTTYLCIRVSTMTLNLSNTTDFPMWKIFKFILFIIFVSFSFNVAKSKEGEIWQFFILLMAIGVGYYFFYILPAGEKRDEADCEDERR